MLTASVAALGARGKDVEAAKPRDLTRRKSSTAKIAGALGLARTYNPQDPAVQGAAVIVQAHFRGQVVRRLKRSELPTVEVRRAVRRVHFNRRGFADLLLYLLFCALTCALLGMQYNVERAYQANAAALDRMGTVVGPDSATYKDVGASPDKLFEWIEAALTELHENNERFVVNLDKWAREEDGAAPLELSAAEKLQALQDGGNATSTELAEAAAAVALEASLPPVDGTLGARCNAAEIPSCCRYAAWRRGMAKKDFKRVAFVHNFGHNRVSSPLFVKLRRAARVPCLHGGGEDDPLNSLFEDCYSASLMNTTNMADDGTAEDDRFIWQEFSESSQAFLMPIDLGLFKLPVDQGLCYIERARDFGWVDTSAMEVDVEFATYNGHYELWTLTRLEVSWSLGGNPEVTLETLTAPLRNMYKTPADITRACFEAIYLLFLTYYLIQTGKRIFDGGTRALLNGWVIVDLATHSLAILNIVLWATFAVEAARYRMPEFADKQGSYAADSHELWIDFLKNLARLETAENDFTNFTFVQSLLLMMLTLRLFNFLAFHPQFSLVTATLLRASASLAHFLVVFVIILLMYAFIGYNLLGHKLVRYNTIGNAINSMCSMLVFDDTVSFTDIMEVAPGVGQVFYWSYFVLSSLMLINVLLAILLDAYATVAQSSRTTNYIWVDIGVQYRLFTYYLVHRTIYADIRRVERHVGKVGTTRGRLNLAQVYTMLSIEGLPSFVVWNIVIVLERKALADAEDYALSDKLESMAAQLKQTHKLVAKHALQAGIKEDSRKKAKSGVAEASSPENVRPPMRSWLRY